MKSTNAIHRHVHSRGGVGGKSDLIFIYGNIESNAGMLNPFLPTKGSWKTGDAVGKAYSRNGRAETLSLVSRWLQILHVQEIQDIIESQNGLGWRGL